MSEDIKWEDPPEIDSPRRTGRGRRITFVEKLKKNPMRWAIYDSGKTYQQAASMASQMSKTFPGVESVSRDGSVYARWVGEDSE